MAEYTPMMKQYLKTKEEYKDCILFYRLGDFYEMFFDDAITASGELEITLTGKDCGLKERAPMCGVPHHAYSNYLDKLIEKGYKVAICEQLSDPKEKKMVEIATSGKNKAKAVYGLIKGPITEDMPCSILQKHPDCTIYVDEDAYSLVK